MTNATRPPRLRFVWLLCCTALCCFAACAQDAAASADAEAELQRLRELERSSFAESDTGLGDTAIMHEFVRGVEAFSESYPLHDSTAQLLLDGAGLASGSAWGHRAIRLWGRMWRNFPEHPRAAEALFYQGYTMDVTYGDQALAKQYYASFLERYPGHELAEQVAQLYELARRGGALPPPPTPPAAPSNGSK